jgi:hypothetical protein
MAGAAPRATAAPPVSLALLLALLACAHCKKAKDDLAFGPDATTHLGGSMATIARQYKLKDDKELRGIFDKDKELGVDKVSNKLVYSCGTLVAPNTSDVYSGQRRRLSSAAGDHGSHHRHHHHLHHAHGHKGSSSGQLRSRKVLPEALEPLHDAASAGGASSGRRLLQLVRADLDDPLPSSYDTSASGVPLLHSRPAATRKIFLDFDGHTTRWAGCAGRPPALAAAAPGAEAALLPHIAAAPTGALEPPSLRQLLTKTATTAPCQMAKCLTSSPSGEPSSRTMPRSMWT